MSFLAQAFSLGSIVLQRSVPSREAAIHLAGTLLVDSGRAKAEYVDSMLAAVENHGPYIVIAPGIALAHGKPTEGVLEVGMSLLVLEEPVVFDHPQNDPVRLVFGLAALNHDSHLGLMAELAEFLSIESNVNFLLTSSEPEQIRTVLSKGLGQ